MKSILFLFLFTLSTLSFSQNLNDYKYVLVPEKFEAFNKSNEFRLNDLTYSLLEKHGFKTFKSKSDLPEDALKNNCLILTTEVLKNSSMFKTKVAIQLSNCKGEVVYTTAYGSSRDKKYIVAYNQALRQAGKSFDEVNYKFDTNSSLLANPTTEVSSSEAVLKAEIAALKKEKAILLENKNDELIEKVVEEETILENKEVTKNASENDKKAGEYYAEVRQKTGWKDYNVYDDKGVLYFIFYSTGKKDTYLVKAANNDDKQICFKNDGLWHLVTRNETNMEIKALKINF